MSFDQIPLGVYFIVATLIVVGAVEVGFRLGDVARRRSEDEKESPVSAISGAILGLLAFVMAFTFAIVSDRYDARKALVREEAMALRTAFSRVDLLPEPDRGEAKQLLKKYVDGRLAAVATGDLTAVEAGIMESLKIQDQLWEMAVANTKLGMNSDYASLIMQAINDVSSIHAERVSVGLQARIPTGIWLMLIALLAIGMMAVGYQTAISGSRRSWAALILAISFSLVIALIAALDRPTSTFLPVSQQPLVDARAWMNADFNNP